MKWLFAGLAVFVTLNVLGRQLNRGPSVVTTGFLWRADNSLTITNEAQALAFARLAGAGLGGFPLSGGVDGWAAEFGNRLQAPDWRLDKVAPSSLPAYLQLLRAGLVAAVGSGALAPDVAASYAAKLQAEALALGADLGGFRWRPDGGLLITDPNQAPVFAAQVGRAVGNDGSGGVPFSGGVDTYIAMVGVGLGEPASSGLTRVPPDSVLALRSLYHEAVLASRLSEEVTQQILDRVYALALERGVPLEAKPPW